MLKISLCRFTMALFAKWNKYQQCILSRKWQKGECTIPSDCAFRHHYTEGDDQVEEVMSLTIILS